MNPDTPELDPATSDKGAVRGRPAATCSPLPDGLTRAEAVEGLKKLLIYAESWGRHNDPSFRRWPLATALVDHIAAHGFPPPDEENA